MKNAPATKTAKRYKVVPMQLVAEVEDAEYAEDGERNHFLNDLELVGRELPGAETIGRHLQAVLKEGDRPADKDDLP